FGLDIGTNAIRVVELSGGPTSWNLEHFAYVPIDSKITASDSPEARRRLGEGIITAIGQSGIKTHDVAVGLPSNKTFNTVVDIQKGSDAELKAAMKYQIDQYIPGVIEETKVDWALLGPSLHAQDQQEVLISSVAKSYSEQRLEFIEQLGFNVIAIEPDPIAMTRALVPHGNQAALLLLDMGEQSTDIVVVYGDTPRLLRTIPTGLSSFIKAATQNLNVQEDQARQFILKFGLASDRLEGQVLHALEVTLDGFSTELVKSIKFFQTRYPNVTISAQMLTGFAATMPLLDRYLATKTNVPATTASPWQGINVSQNVQSQLAPVANEFATVVGLAKRGRVE
ncbi:pilus assembly protein PilM, partial [Candidatus Saccharibacteria bacterium]|nr:pilus assembly protein PilM [Candidatus Saccharibacteria bacterium]